MGGAGFSLDNLEALGQLSSKGPFAPRLFSKKKTILLN